MILVFSFHLSGAVSGSVVGVCGRCAVCVSGGLCCHQSAAAEGSGVSSESRLRAGTMPQGKTHAWTVYMKRSHTPIKLYTLDMSNLSLLNWTYCRAFCCSKSNCMSKGATQPNLAAPGYTPFKHVNGLSITLSLSVRQRSPWGVCVRRRVSVERVSCTGSTWQICCSGCLTPITPGPVTPFRKHSWRSSPCSPVSVCFICSREWQPSFCLDAKTIARAMWHSMM